MKFVSLIASTLLIVLISQHSSTALPIKESTTEQSCLEGFELVDGSCVKIKHELQQDRVESSSPLFETITHSSEKEILQADELQRLGACPKGMVRGQQGICKEVISQDQPAITIEPKTDHEERLEVTGEPLQVTVEPLEVTSEPLELTSEPLEVTGEPLHVTGEALEVTGEPLEVTEGPSDVTGETLDVTGEPLDVTGEPLVVTEESLDVTDEPLEVTSARLDVDRQEDQDAIRKPGSIEIPKGCPSGTKPDEDGSCQDIKQTTTKKTVTNLKVLLKKDGSCPDNMKKINGLCMYVKSKATSKIDPNFPSVNDDAFAPSRSRLSNDKNSEYQPVPVLSDNSCPKGTEYSEYGVCRKRIRPSNLNALDVTKSECPDDQVFVGGRCILKKVEVLLPSKITTKVIKSGTSAPETDHSEDDESPRSTIKTTTVKETSEEV